MSRNNYFTVDRTKWISLKESFEKISSDNGATIIKEEPESLGRGFDLTLVHLSDTPNSQQQSFIEPHKITFAYASPTSS